MLDRRIRTALGAVAVAGAFLAPACTSASEHPDESMSAAVTMEDPWASAADTGMAAVFGTFTNTGHHEARIVSGRSPQAGRVEVHEVVTGASGTKTMRPKDGGLTIPADGAHRLVPGGDHLMLMDLTQPLQPGADVTLTVTFEDGSTLPVTAQVRDFPGADEEYVPGDRSHQGHG